MKITLDYIFKTIWVVLICGTILISALNIVEKLSFEGQVKSCAHAGLEGYTRMNLELGKDYSETYNACWKGLLTRQPNK